LSVELPQQPSWKNTKQVLRESGPEHMKKAQPAFRAEDRIDEGGGLPQTMSKDRTVHIKKKV